MDESQLSPEQLADAIRQMNVGDILLGSLTTVLQLGFAKLEPGTRDLEQAKLAIEALRALLPVLEGTAPEEAIAAYRQATADLQVAYVAASGAAAGGEPSA